MVIEKEAGINAVGGAKAPWHVWIVGLVATIWNGFGCAVYYLAMIRDPQTMAGAPPEMVAAFEAAPAWSNAAWAIGVWGGLLGSLLLLLRSRWSFGVYLLSFTGLIVTAIYEIAYRVPVDLPQTFAIWIVAIFLLWYARRMRLQGVLR